jgi:hypothetical protein
MNLHRITSAALRVVAVCWLGCLASAVGAAEAKVRQILLVQNSGWMLPFYEDASSKFKGSINDFAARIQPFGSELVVANFNQSIGDNRSPALRYRGRDLAAAGQAIASMQPARKPGSATYADTDFREALVSSIRDYTPGEPAILWIVTNNRNSPNNSAETVERNKEFYRFLQETKEIERIVGYPMKLPAVARSRSDYSANGLMIYGMAYGGAADAVLQQMIASRRVFGDTPVARLKPLNAEALTFVPTAAGSAAVKVRLSPHDRRTLIISFSAGSRPERAQLQGKLRNDFFPYDIQSASLDLQTQGFESRGRGKLEAKLNTPRLSDIPAGGESGVVSIDLQIPPLPSMFSPDVVFGTGYRMGGTLQLRLDDQVLAVSPKFVGAMNGLFPRDPLPDLFTPGSSARSSITDQPLVIEVEYPTWPLMVVSAAVLLSLFAGGGALTLARRETRYKVSIDGSERTYAMRPFGQAELRNGQGERIGTLKRGWGPPRAEMDPRFRSASVRIR